jgi:hypothetical protein
VAHHVEIGAGQKYDMKYIYIQINTNTIQPQDLRPNMNTAGYEYDTIWIWIQYDMGSTVFKYF